MPQIMNFYQIQSLLTTSGGKLRVHVVNKEETGHIVDINPSEQKILIETQWDEDREFYGGSIITYTHRDQYWVSPEDIVLL